MDEVKIKSIFSRMILSRVITNFLAKKIGDGIEVHVNDFEIVHLDDADKEYYRIKMNIDSKVSDKIMEDLTCKKQSGSGTS